MTAIKSVYRTSPFTPLGLHRVESSEEKKESIENPIFDKMISTRRRLAAYFQQ